jgi:hypothetical protein
VEVVPYIRGLDRSQFDSGQPALDEWLRTQATQQEKANNTRTFLGVDDDRVLGYYATTTYRLELDEAATMYGAGRRVYPVPAVLLARLAVDHRCKARVGSTAVDTRADGDSSGVAKCWVRGRGHARHRP